MIFLYTGVPGTGKTLNAIKEINENKQFQDRDVYYCNIKEVKPENDKNVSVLTASWIEKTPEEIKGWNALPDGAVIFIDEAQHVFPMAIGRKGKPDDFINQLTEHRHKGFDIFLCTQHPKLIDVFVRRLVSSHRHHERIRGLEAAKVFEWENGSCDDPDDYHERQKGAPQTFRYDKKYYGCYKSAEFHTQRKRIPWHKVGPVIFGIILIPIIIFYAYDSFMNRDRDDLMLANNPDFIKSETKTKTELNKPGLGLLPSSGSSSQTMTTEQYINTQIPRIKNVPWSAPIYDSIRTVSTYPIPICINLEKRGCRCYSQQATRLNIDEKNCLSILKNGVFDSAKKPIEDNINNDNDNDINKTLIPSVEPGWGGNSRRPPATGLRNINHQVRLQQRERGFQRQTMRLNGSSQSGFVP